MFNLVQAILAQENRAFDMVAITRTMMNSLTTIVASRISKFNMLFLKDEFWF
jgi:hypothetical protein